MQKTMNFRKWYWGISLFLLFVGAILMNPDGAMAQNKTLLRMGAVPSGSGWYFYMTQFSNTISQNLPNVDISVRETGGTRENTIRMSKNELERGLTEALVAYEAYRQLLAAGT